MTVTNLWVEDNDLRNPEAKAISRNTLELICEGYLFILLIFIVYVLIQMLILNLKQMEHLIKLVIKLNVLYLKWHII